jgi:hypothetical protein
LFRTSSALKMELKASAIALVCPEGDCEVWM